MMKKYKFFLFLIAVCTTCLVNAQTDDSGLVFPVTNGYAQESDGAYKTEQIYLRAAGGFNRTGFVVFSIKDLGTAYSASLNLTVKNFREDLGNPIAVDFHVAVGDLISPLVSASNAYTSAPDKSAMNLAHTMTFDGSKDTDDMVSIDITKALNEVNMDGTAEFVTIRINSDSSNAFLQFYSNAESDQNRWPSLEVISSDDVVITSPIADGFLQKDKDFVSSDIYVRGQGTTDASFHREGYIVLAQDQQFGILNAKLQLTARVDTRATGAAPDSIPQFIVSLAEGDLISGILSDGTTDWDQRPADSNFSSIDTLDVNGVLAGEVVEIDLTDQVNSFISGGTVDKYTLRLMDTTANDVLARFHTSADEDEAKRPKLVVIASCAAELVEIDTVVCSTAVPFTLEAELAANNITVSENGVYDVLFTTPCGAVLNRQYTVDIINNGDFTENPEICAGEEFLGRTESETFTIEKVSSDGSCTEKITYNLTVNTLPNPDLGEDLIIKDDETISLDAGDWSSYLWSTGETSQTINVSLSSENFVLGPNTIIVDVTDANACLGSDTIVVNIKDQSIPTITEIPTFRSDKDGFFDLGTRIEIKNDLYGDLNTPEGEGPFFTRVIFMEFDISAIKEEVGDQVLTSAVLQMYNYDNDEITIGNRPDLIHNTNIAVGASLQSIDPEWTWETQPDASTYPVQDVHLNLEEEIPSFNTWDLTEFVSESVLEAGESIFSLRITAPEDTASTLVKYRSPKYSVAAQQPKLLYEFGVSPLTFKGEIRPILLVYPNPSHDVLKVKGELEVISYEITDLSGRVVKKEDSDYVLEEISIISLNKGVYFLKLQTTEGVKTSKFIKK